MPNQANSTPISSTLTLDHELANLIQDAIATDAIIYALTGGDRRWDTAHDLLRYQREEIGTHVVWQCLERELFGPKRGLLS